MVGEINFGILDPNTPMQVAGSFQQGQANALARQAAQQTNALNAMKLQQASREMADEDAMRQAYAQSGGDMSKVIGGLQQRGLYKPAMELQSQINAQQIAQRKAHIEEGLQQIDVLGRIAGGVKDQASYDQARAQLASIFGPDAVANIPPVYDPNAVAQFRTQALSAKDQLEQQWKAADYMLGQQKLAFEKGKFGAEMGLKQKQFGLEQYKTSPEYQMQVETIKAAAANKPQVQAVKDANDALMIIGEAEKILNTGKATGSYAGKAADILASSVGYATPGAKQAASLKALSGALVSKMPKMSGPQSDKDVLLYREMAGQIGDDTLPIEIRKEALKTVKNLQEKYAGKESSSDSGWKDL